MNSERISPTTHPALDKRAQAAAWLARLRGPQRSSEVERGFQRWLGADSEHRRAFELVSERLEIAERLRVGSLPRGWRHREGTGKFRWPPVVMGVAATLAVVWVTGTIYLHNAGVATQIGEQRMLTLADRSRIYLNTDTRIVVQFDKRVRQVELKNGEALFEVAKNAGRPFVVVAGERTVQVLGTTFVVRRDENKTAVTLIEGKVAVSNSQAPPSKWVDEGKTQPQLRTETATSVTNLDGEKLTVLSPGERMTFGNNKPARLDSPSVSEVTAWRQGQVALDDMPLSDAAIEMNRYSKVRLTIENPQAETVRVGGFFRMGDSASFARAVASRYGLQVVERPEEIVLAGLPRQ